MMQHDQTWIGRPLNQIGDLRGIDSVQEVPFIGFKDSRVET